MYAWYVWWNRIFEIRYRLKAWIFALGSKKLNIKKNQCNFKNCIPNESLWHYLSNSQSIVAPWYSFRKVRPWKFLCTKWNIYSIHLKIYLIIFHPNILYGYIAKVSYLFCVITKTISENKLRIIIIIFNII